MQIVVAKIGEARLAGTVLPSGEYDVLMVGDLNASWFDNNIEQFFDNLNNGDWKVLAKDSAYPATRLAGEPLSPKSQIDYLIASRHQVGKRGLFGQEVTAEQAVVHHHLADGDWYYFRRVFSDHFPTCVAVIPDDDQSRSDDGTCSAMVCVMGRRRAASPTEDVLTAATPRATVRRQL